MNALLVIDMQEEYVGASRNKNIYSYDAKALISAVNKKIREYSDHNSPILYIQNKFLWQSHFSNLVEELDVIHQNIFVKRRANSFSNKDLLSFIKENDIHEIELVGVDGNYCVGKTALSAREHGLSVLFYEMGIGISNPIKFIKTKQKLIKAGVKFLT